MDSKPVQLSNSADTPVTPPEIIEAATAGRLILFVGAGVSRLAGGPSWADAADIAFKELVDKGLLPFAEAEQLRTEHPKKRLSIAMDISEEASLKMNFERIFCPPEEQIDAQIYRDLYSLGVPIVTTNYDAGLDRQAEMELPLSGTVQAASTLESKKVDVSSRKPGAVYFNKRDLTIEKLMQPGAVIHLHGSVRNHKTMVVSTRQYMNHYGDEFVRTFLGQLFEGDYSVLFIGYGLDEEEVIEYITQKNRKSTTSTVCETKHFWLYPHLAYQEARFKHLSSYYLNHCNVSLVKFSIDRAGYCQLKDVIVDWIEVLRSKVRAPEFLDKIRLIDKVI